MEIAPLAGSVVSDAKWLGFILEQLLSNAVKYTNEGGVKICMESGRLVIEDSGIGIRPEDLPRIFEKGYTGYNGRVDTRASGVGLYLTRQVADALAIRIDVRSQLGHGTRVALSFRTRTRSGFGSNSQLTIGLDNEARAKAAGTDAGNLRMGKARVSFNVTKL